MKQGLVIHYNQKTDKQLYLGCKFIENKLSEEIHLLNAKFVDKQGDDSKFKYSKNIFN